MTDEKQIYNYAIRLLAGKRYHSAELRQKLEKRSPDAPEEVTEKIIEKLINYGYLNDAEYMRLYIDDQIKRKPQGPRLITQKLLRKGIRRDEIKRYLELANLDQLELAIKAIAKRKIDTSDPAKRAKQARFLQGRGFDLTAIIQAGKSQQPDTD